MTGFSFSLIRKATGRRKPKERSKVLFRILSVLVDDFLPHYFHCCPQSLPRLYFSFCLFCSCFLMSPWNGDAGGFQGTGNGGGEMMGSFSPPPPLNVFARLRELLKAISSHCSRAQQAKLAVCSLALCSSVHISHPQLMCLPTELWFLIRMKSESLQYQGWRVWW